MTTKNHKIRNIILHCFIGFIYILSYSVICICNWMKKTFDVGIEAIFFTLANPIKGTDSNIIKDAVKYCLPRIIFIAIIYILVCIFYNRRKTNVLLHISSKTKTIKINTTKLFKIFISFSCVISLIFSIMYVDKNYSVIDYFKLRSQATTIYEDYYIDPMLADIKLEDENGKRKNLIHIYLESMETTASSVDVGGLQSSNYITNLTNLANDNISFSNSTLLGGFQSATGTGFTFGSLLAQTSGIPFSFPVDGNSLSNRTSIAKSMTNLGDILNSFGYTQKFLCGSDGDFAGRKTFFEQHGNYEVIDYNKSVEKGYIDKNHHVAWGFEDYYLFEIAKTELLSLANASTPFNLTMLTVDTHSPDGYICKKCDNKYPTQIANAFACTDKQVYEFIEWCKTQSFYENTIIIITGDHPLMSTRLIENIPNGDSYNRTIYNCFINIDSEQIYNTQNRIFTPFDIFPTTLSALGFCWDGDRLALGTNMFSNSKTLAEELGYEYFNTELKKYSKYYATNFY